jgi:hypothetical protein
MSKVGTAKYFYPYLLVLSITMGAEYSHARGRLNELATETWTQPINGVRISVYTPTQNYKDPNAFQLSVLFENLGKEKLIILPESIHRNYQSRDQGTARYVPFPGPRISPWKDAFTLLPDRRNEIKFVGMRDGDGLWISEPGTYDLSIRYIIPQDWAAAYARDFPNSKVQPWTGSIEGGKLIIKFLP